MFRARIKPAITNITAIWPPRRILQQGEFENPAALGAARIGASAVGAIAAGKIQEWNIHISSRRFIGWVTALSP
jgi:hypothetical protein